MKDESRPAPQEPTQLTRSTNDRVIAGVCAGVAAYLGVTPMAARIGALVLCAWVTPAPVLFAYIVAAFALPEQDTPVAPVTVDWQPNSMRVTWKGRVVPYVLSWARLLGLFAGAVFAFGLLTIVLAGQGSVLLHAPLALLALVSVLYLTVPQTYALTLSESALWIEAPGKRQQRIDLADIEAIHPTSRPFTIHLRHGGLVQLAPPPSGPELDVVLDEVRRGLARVADHERTLEAAEGDRRRLLGVAATVRAPEEG